MTLRPVREVTTADLRVGDVIDWHGEYREVTECRDTGRAARFGMGSEYVLAVIRPSGERVPMHSAASDRWLRI